MWFKGLDSIDFAKEFFVQLCNQLNVKGQLMYDNDEKNYLVVIAPEGGYRTYELNETRLKNVVAGWGTQDAKREIKKDVLIEFLSGGLNSTSFLDLSDTDREFFSNFGLEISEMLSVVCRG